MTAGRRTTGALAAVVAVLLASAAVAVTRVGATQPAVEITKVGEASFDNTPGAPFFAAVVGHDGRPGLEGERGDALHVVGVNPAEGRATILNIPRDTYGEIPGRGRDKINAAYLLGGPTLQSEALARLTGAPISFVITTSFDGLVGMVNELGGVTVDVPFAMNERVSGAVFPQGTVHMDGHQALAFARNRYVPDGDLRRSEHQTMLIIAALAKMRAEVGGPTDTLRAMGVLARHTRVDGVSMRDLYGLGRAALAIEPANVRNVTMPSRLGFAGGASVVFPAPAAAGVFADFRDDAVLQAH